jgi:hypothetical protein
VVDDQSFTVCKVSWLTKVRGNEHRRDEIVRHVYYFAKFLQDHGLVRGRLVGEMEDVDDDFAIRSDDLTSEGLSVVRDGYEKWLGRVDRGMAPTDLRILERSLAKLRAMN